MSFIFGALLLGIMLFMGYQYYCLYQLTQERQVLMSYDPQHDIKNITVPVFKNALKRKILMELLLKGFSVILKAQIIRYLQNFTVLILSELKIVDY